MCKREVNPTSRTDFSDEARAALVLMKRFGNHLAVLENAERVHVISFAVCALISRLDDWSCPRLTGQPARVG